MLALVRKAIVRSLFRLCKAISFTELPDYRGVFTRSTFHVGSDKKRGEASLRPEAEKNEFPFSKEQFHEHHEAEANHERGKAEMLDAFL